MAFQDKALDGCTALVTGGSRGIGRAVCVALGARGAKVAINFRSREDAAQETAELVENDAGRTFCHYKAVAVFVEWARRLCGVIVASGECSHGVEATHT